MIKFLITFVITLFSCNVYALDLRDYFTDNYTVQLNTNDGTPQSKYTFFTDNAGLYNIYTNYLNLNKPGTPFYWKKDYFINGAWCTSTYAIMFKGNDQSIIEAGDWLASTPCTPNVMLGYKSNNVPSGLVWSSETVNEINVWRQSVPSSSYAYSGYQAFSKSGVVDIIPAFKPKYGRKNGQWAEGNGSVYTDVVHIVMYHGTRKEINQVTARCNAPVSAIGAYYQSFKNYNSYAIELWLAKGIGIIQERTTFIEDGSYWNIPNCNGYVFNPAYEWYKDEVNN